MVTEIAKELREKIYLDDNLFLDRYAQSVTNNGININLDANAETGYGVWRLTEKDLDQILNTNSVRR